MRTTQTSCPFCGSMLNFGQEVAAGTMVPCLICDRSFAVQEVSVSETAAPPPVVPTPPPEALLAVAAVLPPPAAVAPDEPRPVLTPPSLAPAFPVRGLILGGIAFAGVAVVLLGGLGMILLAAFPARPVGNDPPASPVPQAAKASEAPPNAMPLAGTKPAPAGSVLDLVDLKKPAAPEPLAVAKAPKAAGDLNPLPLPTVPIVVKANAPGVEQQHIDQAIAKGVRYLKDTQAADGGWGGAGGVAQQHPVGYAALGGLTLLECKVPADDPGVQNAARFVRSHVANLNTTYELSLAILFLDRLGNPRDKIIIQGLALRLLAGQNSAGGWTYHCQMLTPPEMQKLLTYLKSHRPATPALPRAVHPPADLAKQTGTPGASPKQTKGRPDDPFQQLAALIDRPRTIQEGAPIPREVQGSAEALPRASGAKPDDIRRPKDADGVTNPAPADKKTLPDPGVATRVPDKAKKIAPINPRTLPMQLQKLPVVGLSWFKGKVKMQRGRGDNSNTQFALLALWAARRHDVPTEYSLRFGKERFVASQHQNDGGWGYHMQTPTTNTMTCVGLLGLAFGHGAGPDLHGAQAKLQDPAIQRGLSTLGRYIGTPALDTDARPAMQNLYFLWSVERVAMLYDLKTIGGKDWYGWGAQTLLPNQAADGHWQGGQYHAAASHTDTCFALLFLRRSNLVPDLTQHLRLQMVIRDPEEK